MQSGRFTDWSDVPLVLSVTQAAELLGVTRPTIYAMVRDGKLPSRRFRARRLITKQALQDFLADSDDDLVVGDGNGEPASRAGSPSGS